jgi:hypothetical protein
MYNAHVWLYCTHLFRMSNKTPAFDLAISILQRARGNIMVFKEHEAYNEACLMIDSLSKEKSSLRETDVYIGLFAPVPMDGLMIAGI